MKNVLMNAPLSESLLARRLKLISSRNGFMVYGKLGVDFCTSDLCYPNMKDRLRPIRIKLIFHMYFGNPNAYLAVVDFRFTLVLLLPRMIVTKNSGQA